MYAVIMAGGKGTRFWPRSREAMPKHLLDIAGPRSIIRETVDRISPLIPHERILIVTGGSHAAELARQLPDIPGENILVEPIGRNTAPCIGWAALEIGRRDPEGVMAVFPADQIIRNRERFLQIVEAAGEVARKGDVLVTVGIPPTGPETGYGYLERGERRSVARGEAVYRVRSVREKPDLAQAKVFLQQGHFFWNSGMFVWTLSSVRRAIARWLPELHRDLQRMEKALGEPDERDVLEKCYLHIAPVSVDYGVMEKADNVCMLEGHFGWSDVGSWDALWEISDKDRQNNVFRAGSRTVALDSRDVLVDSRKLVALVGVRDLIVVETDDALLVCRRGESQKVRNVVDMLEKRNWRDLL